jgi:hypothetical protein
MFQSNKTLIIIMILVGIFFVGVLGLLYFTFGNNSISNNLKKDITSSSINFTSKTNKTFETEDTIVQSISSQSQTVIAKVELKPTEITNISSSSIQFSSNSYSDIVNPELKLPVATKVEYNFDAKDKETIGKYIKTDYENKIISKLKDDKNSEIIALKIPQTQIDPQTQKDFPKTFKFSNEDRSPLTKDKIFLYYTADKRVAYLGEYISDLQPFQYESQNYWMILYNNQILISKPNFSNWKTIDLQNDPVQAIYKKSEFEFEILKSISYENYDQNKIETISPQKYIIDGIFKEQLDG